MKYLLYSAIEYPQAHEQPLISGLFHWRRIFDGDIGLPTDENLFSYDVIHVNLTRGGMTLPRRIRQRIGWRSKPRLIINVDYAIEMWRSHFSSLAELLDNLSYADFVFHVERTAADALSVALGRPVYWIPHPVDVDTIEQYRSAEREPYIYSIIHRYEHEWVMPWIASQGLGLQSIAVLISTDPPHSVKACVNEVYDGMMQTLSYEKWLGILAQGYAGVESYSLHSYGRTTAEAAALGVPCVGSQTVGSIAQCFPDLVTEPCDVRTQRELVYRLINDREFWRHCVHEGRQRVRMYDHEHSKDRFLRALMQEGLYTPGEHELPVLSNGEEEMVSDAGERD